MFLDALVENLLKLVKRLKFDVFRCQMRFSRNLMFFKALSLRTLVHKLSATCMHAFRYRHPFYIINSLSHWRRWFR